MKRKTKDGIHTLAGCLYDLFKTGTVISVAMLLSQGRSGPKLLKAFAKFSTWRIRQMLREQKLRGYIVFDEEDEHSPIILTKKGITRITKRRLRNMLECRWDHLWRMVIFDIPDRSGKRRWFQQLLKRLGFYRLQKSVYVHPFDCGSEILQLASTRRIASYCLICTVPNLGSKEWEVRRFFLTKGLRSS